MSNLQIPPLSSVRAFEAVGRLESVSKAADELNVTAAAISQQIRNLENHIGQRVLERDGRNVKLTETGRTLYADIHPGLATIYRAFERMNAARIDRPLAISSSPVFGVTWLVPALQNLRKVHPDLRVNFETDDTLIDFGDGRIDLAIRYGRGNWEGLKYELFLETRMLVVAAPSLLDGKSITTPQELLNFPWVTIEREDVITRWLKTIDIDPTVNEDVTIVDGGSLRGLLIEGHGIGAMSSVVASDAIASGKLQVLFDARGAAGTKTARDPDGLLGYYLVWREGHEHPDFRRFRSWLYEYKAETGVE